MRSFLGHLTTVAFVAFITVLIYGIVQKHRIKVVYYGYETVADAECNRWRCRVLTENNLRIDVGRGPVIAGDRVCWAEGTEWWRCDYYENNDKYIFGGERDFTAEVGDGGDD
jgi:hypothetical protein